MAYAAFILSTGRCGTQWIASNLGKTFSDVLDVEHEPLDNRYDPRRSISAGHLKDPVSSCPPVILEHLKNIENQLTCRSYLECGHPNWSTMPIIADRFGDQMRIIHLIRHPVPTCFSWLTHGAYQQPLLPHIPEKILLSPFDEGVRFKDYQVLWDGLTPYEKCLYYWTEVNAFAVELRTRLNVPWLQLRYEDLFWGDGLDQLLDFLDLPRYAELVENRKINVDKYHYLSIESGDWQLIKKYPVTMELAQIFGYYLDAIDEASLIYRYLGQTRS